VSAAVREAVADRLGARATPAAPELPRIVTTCAKLCAASLSASGGECTRVRIVNATSAWPNQVLDGRRFAPDHAGDAKVLGHREVDVRAVVLDRGLAGQESIVRGAQQSRSSAR